MVTAVNLTSGNTGASTSSVTTASVSPSANKLQLLAVTHRNFTGVSIVTPTVTGAGLTWVLVASIQFDTGPTSLKRVNVFRAMGASPSTGALTIDFASESQTDVCWSLDEFTSMDTGGTNGSAAIVQSVTAKDETGTATSITATLAAFGSTSNATYGAFAHVAPTNGATASPGSGFTSLSAQVDTVIGQIVQFKTTNDTSVDGSISAASFELGMIAIEIKAAGGTTYNDSVAESVTAADTPTAVAVYGAAQAESVAAADTPSAIAVYGVARAESVAAADTPSAVAVYGVTQAESVAAADTPSAVAVYPVARAESVAAADTQTAGLLVTGAVAESVAAADTQTAGTVRVGATAEALITADTETATLTVIGAVAESVAAADTESAIATYGVAQAESVAAADTQDAAVVQGAVTVAESVAAADTQTAVATFGVAQAESVAAADTPSAVAVYPVAQAESVAAADTQTAGTVRVGATAESVAAADTQTAALARLGATDETIAAADTQNAAASYGAVQAEAVAAAETQSAAQVHAGTVAETLAVVDDNQGSIAGQGNVFNVSVAETLNVRDSLSQYTKPSLAQSQKRKQRNDVQFDRGDARYTFDDPAVEEEELTTIVTALLNSVLNHGFTQQVR